MKYQRKPFYIEAKQWWRHGDHELVGPVGAKPGLKLSQVNKFGWLDTPQGGHVITPGDWIIIGPKGEVSSCNSRTFAKLYEPVPCALPVDRSAC